MWVRIASSIFTQLTLEPAVQVYYLFSFYEQAEKLERRKSSKTELGENLVRGLEEKLKNGAGGKFDAD